MKKHQKEYRGIVKATALFGGVQAFQVLLSLIRTKVIAILLGVDGVGLLNLFNSTLTMMQSITGFGINQGGVKSISSARNEHIASRIASLLRKMSLFAGLIGSMAVISLSPLLSRWSFGNDTYTYAYVWLSCTLLFDTLCKGELAIFQGFRHLRVLAKANLLGATTGLALSLPIYYIWHVDGVIAAIIVSSLFNYVAALVFRKKEKVPERTSMNLREEGKSILTIGAMLTISGFTSTLVNYLFNIYLRSHGGLTDVGLYQSGFSIIDKYLGLIFVAMSTDYYPRLAGAARHHVKLSAILNQQNVVSLLILCPVVLLFLPTAPLIVELLLTKSFLPVIPFLTVAVLGMLFKVLSNSLGYILIVKDATKWFIGTELLSWGTILVANIIGYRLWGMEGIGIAFVFSYISYFFEVWAICRWVYKVQLNWEVIRFSVFTLAATTASFVSVRCLIPSYPAAGYSICGLLAIGATYVSTKKMWHHLK